MLLLVHSHSTFFNIGGPISKFGRYYDACATLPPGGSDVRQVEMNTTNCVRMHITLSHLGRLKKMSLNTLPKRKSFLPQ